MAIYFSNAFLDIDYTLTDFQKGHNAALESIGSIYKDKLAIQFDLVFKTILFSFRVKDDDWSNVPGGKQAYLSVIKKMQQFQKTKNQPTVWSRELHAMIALERCSMKIDEKEAIGIADRYWNTLTSNSGIYSDAKKFITLLNDNNILYHLFTGSDGSLKYKNGLWKYDSDYSLEKKMRRISWLKKYDIIPASITIGDPVDKPNLSYYKKMMLNASQSINNTINPKDSIVVGDSFINDISAPMKEFDFKYGYWINRQGEDRDISDKVSSITSLMNIPVVS